MKLTDLNPHWLALEENGPHIGITFLCPHCLTTRLAVAYHHKDRADIEDQYILAHAPHTDHIWTVEGTTFDDLTLTPSVDTSQTGHWHGFITNGEIK